jgi:hypothetical protein
MIELVLSSMPAKVEQKKKKTKCTNNVQEPCLKISYDALNYTMKLFLSPKITKGNKFKPSKSNNPMALKKKCSHFLHTTSFYKTLRTNGSISTISIDPLNNSHKHTQPYYYTFNSLVHSK